MNCAKYKLEFASVTDKGKVRANNEDSVLLDPEIGFTAVADGMGGHNSGELASTIAVNTIRDAARKMISGAAETVQIDADLSKEANQLSLAASEANLKILSDKNPQNKGMGTTLSAILIKDRRAVLVHVGDSRIYLLRHNVLTQLTADHSLVAEHVRNGILTEEEARKSSLQNILTRAMGISPTILLDVEELEIKPGDKILLCTDGLNKVVTDAEIIKVLIETDSAAIICKTLTDAALLAGAPDNVTVAAILVHGE